MSFDPNIRTIRPTAAQEKRTKAADLVEAMLLTLDLSELPRESDVHATQSEVLDALETLIACAREAG